MLISTKGRYSLRVLVDLAEHQGESAFIPLKEIAQRQGISEKYLESIIKLLVSGEVLVGLRGKGGGYRLNLPPAECSVERVLRLTEGTLAPVSCLEEETANCPRLADCRTLPIWQGLDQVINDYLSQVSIADLMRSAPTEEEKREP